MEFVLKALEGIFSIVFIIGIGFVLSRRGWFDEYSSALIARLVTAVLRIVDQHNQSVNYFTQIMRRDIGGHAYSNAGTAINEKSRYLCR